MNIYRHFCLVFLFYIFGKTERPSFSNPDFRPIFGAGAAAAGFENLLQKNDGLFPAAWCVF